jgi:hypothetical protein
MDHVCEALDRLVAAKLQSGQTKQEPVRFFISYPRQKISEADLIETLLRRRNLEVFRDDQAFDPNCELTEEIRQSIHRSDIFVALWCTEYACSPWCYDELAHALGLRSAEKIKIWLLQLDSTRIVPPEARGLIAQPCHSREEIQNVIIKLLDKESMDTRGRT